MIEVRHLTKRYGDTLAVDDLNFTIEKGRIYGFLGPNGAGKFIINEYYAIRLSRFHRRKCYDQRI